MMDLVSLADLAALCCALLWALTGLLLRTQAERIPPATMNVTRCMVAGTLFLVLLPFQASPGDMLGVPLREYGMLAASVVVGIGVGDTLYLIALKELGIARTMALSGIFPLTTMVWEAVLLGHAPSSSLAGAGLLVAAGVVLLSRAPDAGAASGQNQTGTASGQRVKMGVMLSVAAAVFWGLSSVLLKPAVVHLSLIQANAVRMPLVALFLFVFRILPSRSESLRSFDRRSFLIVALTGVLGMGVGATLFLYAIQHSPVAKAVTLTATAPFFGLILGVIFLRERLTLRLLVGMGCCLAGVLAVI